MKLFSTSFLTFFVVAVLAATKPVAGKKILVSFDGTTNNARDMLPDEATNDHFTNVLKLHWLAGGDINNRRNDVPGQICLYQRGIGAMTTNPVLAKLNGVLGMLSTQWRPMRKKLEKVYEEGDTLYIIGFSRGSAAARKFVTELQKKGLRTASGGRVKEPPVKFLGVFDTVSSQVFRHFFLMLGRIFSGIIVPSRVLGEKGGKIPSIVEKAVHHVGLDERDVLFAPTHMDSKDELNRVHECFFPGAHKDIGGGYYVRGLSDESAIVMQEWLEKEGIKFIKPEEIHPDSIKIDGFPDIVIDKMSISFDPNPGGNDNIEPYTFMKFDRPVVTVTNQRIIKDGTPRIHVSTLRHMEAMKEKGTPYDINPEMKKANFVVVGSFDEELKEETKRLKELLNA